MQKQSVTLTINGVELEIHVSNGPTHKGLVTISSIDTKTGEYAKVIVVNESASSVPVGGMKIRTRARHALTNAGFNTAGDIAARTERELFWQCKGLGRYSIYEVKKALEELGLRFRHEGETQASSE